MATSGKKIPLYDAQNRLTATVILADPERHLAWPEPLAPAEVEASLMVRWARTFFSQIVVTDEAKNGNLREHRSQGAASYSPSPLTGTTTAQIERVTDYRAKS